MKTNFALLPLDGIRKCAALMTAAQEKYPEPTWMTINRAHHVQAALRHIFSWLAGDVMDQEFGTSHLVNAATRLLMAADVDREVMPKKVERESFRVMEHYYGADSYGAPFSPQCLIETEDEAAANLLTMRLGLLDKLASYWVDVVVVENE